MALDPALDQLAPQANPMPPAPPVTAPAPPPVPQQGPPLGAPGEVGPPQSMLSPKPMAQWPQRDYPPASYIKPPPNRSPKELGGPWWPTEGAKNYPGPAPGPYSPQPSEMYSVMADANGQLASWAPPAVSQPASNAASLAQMLMPMANLLTGGQFGRNYNAASLQRLRAAREQLQFESDQRDAAHTAILQEYGGILALGEADPKFDVKDALAYAAWKHQDHNLEKVIADEGVPAAISYLQHMDAVHRTAQAGATTLRQSTKDDNDAQTDAAWGVPGISGGGARGGDYGYPNLMRGAQGGPAQTAPGGAVPPPPAGSFDDQYIKAHPGAASPDIMQAAHRGFNGGAAQGKQSPGVERAVGDAQRYIASQFDNAGNTPAEPGDDWAQTAQKRIDAAKKIDAEMGQKADDLFNYRIGLDSETINKDYRGQLETFVSNASGGKWKADTFKIAEQYTNPDKDNMKVMGRVAMTNQAAVNVFKAINDLHEEDNAIPRNIINKWLQNDFTGAGKYQNLANQLRIYVQNVAGMQSASGAIRMGQFHEMLRNIQETQSPRSLRKAIIGDMQDVFSFVNEKRRGWEALGRRDLVPGIDGRDYKTMRDIARINTNTGQAAPGSEQIVRTISNNDPSNWSRKLTPDERKTPLPMNEVRGYQTFIDQNKDNPDPEIQNQVQFAIDQVGGIQGIADKIPNVDWERK